MRLLRADQMEAKVNRLTDALTPLMPCRVSTIASALLHYENWLIK